MSHSTPLPAWLLADPAAQALIDQVREELASHIELAVDAAVEAGEDPESARAGALERFGDPERFTAACVAERLRGTLLMKTTITVLLALSLLSFGCLALLYRQSQAAQAAQLEAVIARDHALLSHQLLNEREPQEPRPVVVKLGAVIQYADRNETQGLAGQVEVQPDGMVLLPDVGWLEVYGLSRPELEQKLNEAYGALYADPIQIDAKVTQ